MIKEIVTSSETLIAYLYGFDIDESSLKTAHKQWLDRHVVSLILTHITTFRLTKSKGSIVVWLLGTTSRTAGHGYNKWLSKKRSEAVEDYLKKALKGTNDLVKFDTTGLSEYVAAVRGKENETEDPLDRAVLVYVQKVSTKPDPPKVKRPDPPATKTFFIRIKDLFVDSGSISGPKVGARVDEFKIDFEIVESTARKNPAFYTFSSTMPSMTFGPSDPYASDEIKHRDFVGFTAPGYMSTRDFSGLAMWVVPEFIGNTYGLRFGGGRTKDDENLAKIPMTKPMAKFRFKVNFEEDGIRWHDIRDPLFPGKLKLVK